MKYTTQEIATQVGGQVEGDPALEIEFVASLRNAGPRDLAYADDRHQRDVEASRAGCVLVASGAFPERTVIRVPNPKLAFVRAAALLLAEPPQSGGIHPAATVSAAARLGVGVRIEAGAVVEDGVVIGDRTVLGANAYAGRNCRIGADCRIHPGVVLYPGVEIGNRVIIHAGAVIGADGFGFVQDGNNQAKFPQVGRVVIEDDVEIGANCCIDRGSLETTVIRKGVKLDNLVQIAHNVEIGEGTVIAAQTGISGSTSIGGWSMLGGQVGIGENARLDPQTVIGGQGGVLNSKHVRARGVLWGTPVRPLQEFLEQQAAIARLPRLQEEVRRLRAEIDELKRHLPARRDPDSSA